MKNTQSILPLKRNGKRLVLLLFFIIPFLGYTEVSAQFVISNNKTNALNLAPKLDYKTTFGASEDLSRSNGIYLNNDWLRGMQIVNDSVVLDGSYYRFNMKTNNIEYMAVLDPASVKMVAFGGRFFIWTEYGEDDYFQETWLEMKNDGHVKLLVYRKNVFQEGTDDFKAYGTSDRHHTVEKFYIKVGNKPAILLENRKKQLSEVFGKKSDKMNSFIKSNRIKFYTLANMVDMVNYFNSEG